MRSWDIFCEVVDNFGDIGTCWRLAQQLAIEHEADVRLWVDDLESFSRLCPSVVSSVASQKVGPVDVCHWRTDFPNVEVADVVIEAFACNLPETYVAAMARRAAAPVWINLEYLSAEAWVEECHRLPSPHPRLPLTKYFFFPGFTPATGGLIREHDLLANHAAFDQEAAADFWLSLGVSPPTTDELSVSLFCYENAALPELLQCWADGPDSVRVFTAFGAATEQVARWFEDSLIPESPLRRRSLTAQALPFLPQPTYDRLLWACDINFVRGEDSFVRAQWTQQPFVWQIYPQTEDAHFAKLDAFLSRYLDDCEESDNGRIWISPSFSEASVAVIRAGDSGIIRQKTSFHSDFAAAVWGCWRAWNGVGRMDAAWRIFAANRVSIRRHGIDWANHLDRAGDLANNLARFVRGI